MTDLPTISQRIVDCGAVAVIRLRDAAVVRQVVEALLAGGVTAVEITMTVPGAVKVIEQLASDLPAGALLGAGTVLDVQTVRDVTAAGARFVVSPIFEPALIDAAHECGAASLPGCYTPSEIYAAARRGADIVKVFPAGALGPTFIRDLLAPLPHLRLLPTGGVTPENASQWIRAGAAAVGVGSALVSREAIEARKFDQITRAARTLADGVTAARLPSASPVQ